MKSSIFASDPPVYNIEVGNSSLLSLFYTIKMNRNFIPVLTQVKWGTSTSPKFEHIIYAAYALIYTDVDPKLTRIFTREF